jgi:hypothetical protein
LPEELSKNFVEILTYLAPGFVAAWVFYGLTSHSKPSQFERVVQALIFTVIVQITTPWLQWLLEGLGRVMALRPWDVSARNIVTISLGVGIGALLAYCTNNDTLHGWLRGRGFTTRTSHPSEWFYVFSKKITYVVLHLCDGRRLYGWPKEWPIESDKGQFYIMEPSWITDKGEAIDLVELDGILINAKDVQWVEFMTEPGAVK